MGDYSRRNPSLCKLNNKLKCSLHGLHSEELVSCAEIGTVSIIIKHVCQPRRYGFCYAEKHAIKIEVFCYKLNG
jgi:hypothetical protein